ncbi:RIPK4 [Symbiodinium natans]|uniref:RIPK4 protein n=1 Tax=Symbiodinium natans TaxID=878477 RepID=A0A812GFM1_9DINO|nr:RIPK4 [Symbiodinium natans]
MLHVWLPSGQKLLSTEVGEAKDVLTLKTRLQKLCGRSRFQQRLLHEGLEVADFSMEAPVDLQLVLLPFIGASEEQRDELGACAGSGFLTQVEEILHRPQDPNLACRFERFAITWPLCLAAERGAETVSALIQAGADVNLEAGADVNAVSKTLGLTPLAFAACWGHVEMARLFIQAMPGGTGAYLTGAAIIAAANKGHVEIVRLLVEVQTDKDSSIKLTLLALLCATCHNRVEIVPWLPM